jgi:hypothetical protein
MIAGVVSFDKKISTFPGLIPEMRNAFSFGQPNIEEPYVMENAFIIRANSGAITNYSGVSRYDKYTVSLLAGEPLMSRGGVEKDHVILTNAIAHNDFETLKTVRGVFCAVRYSEKEEPILELCSDKLGIRPLYYWTDGNLIVFSTVLKVLEKLSFIQKIVDEIALSEVVGFGYSLGNRTKYQNIKLLRESELIRINARGLQSFTYWRWDEVEQRNVSLDVATAEAYRLFKESISLRLSGDTNALAFLSGGMDSRSIVATIAEMGVQTQAFNFSPTGSQDQVFASEFAKKIGLDIHLLPRGEIQPSGFRCQLARLCKELVDDKKLVANRPKTIWSGDGGSVSLGCVYLDEQIVEMMRSGNRLGAIHRFRKNNKIYLPLKVIKNKNKKKLKDILDESILSELQRINCTEPGQTFFLFLMFNDQRRHLHDVYEEIYLHNLEYQLPFFDSKFLEFIFSLPLDYRLNHKFYTDWFNVLQETVTTVPWQTYPGHIPCPLPIDKDLSYQWNKIRLKKTAKIKKNLSAGLSGLKIGFFAKDIGPISRVKFVIVSLIHMFGVADYGYVIKAGRTYANA